MFGIKKGFINNFAMLSTCYFCIRYLPLYIDVDLMTHLLYLYASRMSLCYIFLALLEFTLKYREKALRVFFVALYLTPFNFKQYQLELLSFFQRWRVQV